MKHICVIGSLNMDLVVKVDTMPKGGQTLIGSNFKEVPGGKGANQAVAMARLGGNVSMIGKVGNDGFGQTLLNALKADNVNTDYIGIEEGPTGVALITVDKNAENSIVVAPGANFKVAVEDIDNNIEAINNSIRNILTTQKGSLEGMPEFGSRLNELVFSQIDHITVDLLKNLIQEALRQWEDRIIISDIVISSVPEYNRLIASISYRLKDDILNVGYSVSVELNQG